MMDLKWWIVIAIGGVILFMLISRSVTQPLRWLWLGLLYSALGAIVLFLLNLAGQYFHFEIPINPLTAIIAGLVGIPGIVYLILTQVFIF